MADPASVADDLLNKVVFTDRDKLNELCSLLSEEVIGVLKKRVALGEGEGSEFLATFQEKFAQAMKANTRFVGALSELNDKSTEDKLNFGSEDEQQSHLQSVLLPRLDSLSVEVTTKRRDYPSAIRKHLRNSMRAKHTKLVQQHGVLSVASSTTAASSTSSKNSTVQEELLSLTSSIATDLHNFTKDSDSLMAKYERLRTSREQLEAGDRNQPGHKRKHH